MFDSGSMGPIVVLFWLVVNLYNMVMCLFFISGRKTYRKAERVNVQLPATVHVNGKDYPCVTRDISETGAAIYMDEPHFLNVYEKSGVSLEIQDRNYHAEMMCEVKFTKEEKNKEKPWLYTMEFIGFKSERGYDNLLGICYDRIPTKPQGLKKKTGIYDDLSTNISRRSVPVFQLKRYFPRIEIHNALSYDSASGRGMAKIIDFNYQFFLIDGEPVDDEITFELAGYELRTKRCRKIRNMCLYEVQNFQELYENQDVCDEIMEAILKLRGQQTEEPVVEKKKNNMHSFNEMDLV